MPSDWSMHVQSLRADGVVPDLLSVFGQFQVDLMEWVDGFTVKEALDELAEFIGFSVWVVTPEMLTWKRPRGTRPMWRQEREAAREHFRYLMDIFHADIYYWTDTMCPERQSDVSEAVSRCLQKMRSECDLFRSPRRRRRSKRQRARG